MTILLLAIIASLCIAGACYLSYRIGFDRGSRETELLWISATERREARTRRNVFVEELN